MRTNLTIAKAGIARLLTAALAVAMAFTFSCSSDDGNDPGGSSSSGGDNNGGLSSPSGGGGGGSSSSGGGTGGGSKGNNISNYKTVTIGSQVWMAENLDYDVPGSVCYDNDPANCEIYGRFYKWSDAMRGAANSKANPSGVQGVCPIGWHLPSIAEWDQLLRYVDGRSSTESPYESSNGGAYLKSTSGWDWNDRRDTTGNGTDHFGFTGLPGGYCYDFYNGKYGASCADVGKEGNWWSTSEENGRNAYTVTMMYEYRWTAPSGHNIDNKSTYLFNVRCVQNAGGSGGGNSSGSSDRSSSSTDCSRYQRDYNTAKSSVERWQKTLADAEDTYNTLVRNGVSQTSIIAAATTVTQARSSLRTAESDLAIAQRQAESAGCSVY